MNVKVSMYRSNRETSVFLKDSHIGVGERGIGLAPGTLTVSVGMYSAMASGGTEIVTLGSLVFTCRSPGSSAGTRNRD